MGSREREAPGVAGARTVRTRAEGRRGRRGPSTRWLSIPALVTVLLAGCGDDGGRRDGGDLDAAPDVGRTCGAPGSAGFSDPCQCDSDCSAGAVCLPEHASGAPGGTCVGECDSSASCAEGFACIRFDESAELCYRACEDASDCPRGRFCDTMPAADGSTAKVCQPICQDDADCDSGACNRYSGYCDPTDPSLGGLQASCLRNEDCRSNLCEDGRCIVRCLLSRPGCPEDALCAPFFTTPHDAGRCYARCRPDATCEDPSLACVYAGIGTDGLVCVPFPDDLVCRGPSTDNPDDGPCGCDADCGPGGSCGTEGERGWPSGRCLRGCRLPSLEEPLEGADCAEGYSCSNGDETLGFCWHRCYSNDDCGAGTRCFASEHLCIPSCELDSHCPATGMCNVWTGNCEGPTAGVAMGEPCVRDADCKSRICAAELMQCIRGCDFAAQRCPDDTVCAAPDGYGNGLCLKRCTTAADCPRAGAVCRFNGSGLSDHCE